MTTSLAVPITRGSDFAALCREVRAAGLLRRRRLYYVGRAGLLALALATVIAGTGMVDASWFQLLVAAALGVVLTQIAFAGHDAGHQQVFGRRRNNDFAGMFAGNLIVGLSYGWWVDEHTRHHINPNHEDLDPDVAESVLAFTPAQVNRRRGLRGRRPRHRPRTRPASCYVKLGLCHPSDDATGRSEPDGHVPRSTGPTRWAFVLCRRGVWAAMVTSGRS